MNLKKIMKLGQLLEGLPDYDLDGNSELEIKGLGYDSRRIQPGELFVAMRGYSQNGHDYLNDAIRKGAVALVAEEFRESYGEASKILVADSREALSKLAARFYEDPCSEVELIGITGTNGKTTTSYILESILTAAGARPGVIGTINSRFQGKSRPAPVTTPESLDLMRLIREMRDEGATHVVMEVSSHALDQGRTAGCPFRVALFTNFTRDHLDYHNSMEEYFNAKACLFRTLQKSGREGVAVINMDDPRGKELTSICDAEVLTYGLDGKWDFSADSISTDRTGLRARLMTPSGDAEISSTLIGRINLYNILAAAAASHSLGIDLDRVVEGIKRLKTVPGRLELVENRKGLTVVVDYAHTPDALQKAQETLRPLAEGRLITLFGCGGDRDKGKRYEMGLVAGRYSDIVIVTSDNPRSEEPGYIVRQIEEGVKSSGLTRAEWSTSMEGKESAYYIEIDRHKAIQKAISMADKKDLVLIAGKGHEDYQIIGHERRFFDDRKEVVRAAGTN
jgi:UDP-N-acetylmuramoyl-L-alanyl-D-glutamate--2,6-diaminopimelate ligase